MTARDAERRAETPAAGSDGSGQNPPEYGHGASNVTARKDTSNPEPMRQAATQTYITNRRGTQPYARWGVSEETGHRPVSTMPSPSALQNRDMRIRYRTCEQQQLALP